MQFSWSLYQLYQRASANRLDLVGLFSQIDTERQRSKSIIIELSQQIQPVLAAGSSIAIQPAQSAAPAHIPLRFGTTLAYQVAWLIAEYDQLVLLLLTARHTGVLDRSTAEQQIRYGARLIRRVLMIPLSWRSAPLADNS